jgi:hypothetical protein
LKKSVIILGLLGMILLGGLYAKRKFYDPKHQLSEAKSEVKKLADNNEIQNGDLIFQTSLSKQSKAIQLATKSKYSHCGIIFRKENDSENWYVLEAVQPVKWTLLEKWIARGEDGHYVIKRVISDPMLPEAKLKKLRESGERFLGKSYDLTFEWSDDKIYCSELIWKIYKQTTGIEIGKLQKLSDFDLTNELVKNKMKERYGDEIPMNETVISPAAIFDSERLITIKSN